MKKGGDKVERNEEANEKRREKEVNLSTLKVLSFGGGRQTVTIACMICNGDFEKPDVAIFADTQAESKSTYIYNELVKSKFESIGVRYERVTIGNIIEDSIKGDRFASIPFFTESDSGGGMLRRQCTNEYKIQPVYKKIREIIGLNKYQRYKGVVELWIGYSMGEQKRVTNFEKGHRPDWIKGRFPLIEKNMYVDNCLEYLKRSGWGIPDKSACIMCPYKSDLMWADLKNNHPDEFKKACEYEESINKTKVAIKHKVFLHRSMIPLRNINFTNQSDMFDCKWGVCGL